MIREIDYYIRKYKKNHMSRNSSMVTLLLKKEVIEFMTVINPHLEDLKEKATNLKPELTYFTFMGRKMLKYT